MRKEAWLVCAVLLAAAAAGAQVGGGDIVFKVKHMGDVTFRHDTHVETMGFPCTQCHPMTFLTTEQHKSFTMSHRRQAASCGLCHDGETAFSLSGNCYVCHHQEGR